MIGVPAMARTTSKPAWMSSPVMIRAVRRRDGEDPEGFDVVDVRGIADRRGASSRGRR